MDVNVDFHAGTGEGVSAMVLSPNYLNKGVQWFTMLVDLGGSGLQQQELQFTSDGFPKQSSIDGGAVTWTGTVIARELYNSDDEFDDIVVEFPAGWYKQTSTMKFTRPVVFTSQGDTKLEYTGTGNQIIFGPDNITLNGDVGGVDHKLHVTYGFIGNGIFTFTGDLTDHGIVFNEFVTNPRLIGLRFVNYGSETFYQIKLRGQCWEITLDNVRHTNTQSKAVNFISANGKMKDGTVDYGNSRLHVGADVYLHIEGSGSGGFCIDVGGSDYRFDGVAQGWKITHQLGAFAFNARINGYHETIFLGCECLITYGGLPEDEVVPVDNYFNGGVIGGNGMYWNAHNITDDGGYPPTNCLFMRPRRDGVVLIDFRIDKLDLLSYNINNVLVGIKTISGKPSHGNSIGDIGYGSVKLHDPHTLIQPWHSCKENYVLNGSGFLSRDGDEFIVNGATSGMKLFDFYYLESTGGNTSIYMSAMYDNQSINSEGSSMTFVSGVADVNDRYVPHSLTEIRSYYQGKSCRYLF